ncbi:cyclin-dependent kinase 9-like [Stylophora pistillata]|uniref:cyclin-dependent kinase 9-like n=1 Tax=Stylophora pistillata TaxID=50429 RepID=UPI000C052A70|nr:cyclin-dependent kinase 9-like [Stylophora pistillata]
MYYFAHNINKFFNKEEIGRGSYGAVSTAEHNPRGSGNSPEKVVVNKVLGGDLEDKRNFVKEARILRELQLLNIVEFTGICTTPVALILEYAYFDFMPFAMNSRVSSLSGFLAALNDYDCAGFDDPLIFSGISKDIANGLQYLHHGNVAHRDLKPATIFVSNQHYCQLIKEEIGKVRIECPMVCKLADFGESRSSEMQTKSILNSQTLRVNRGTPVYQAPEILVGKTRLSVATIEDMKKADI